MTRVLLVVVGCQIADEQKTRQERGLLHEDNPDGLMRIAGVSCESPLVAANRRNLLTQAFGQLRQPRASPRSPTTDV